MKPPDLRAVIIDDEAPAREILHNLLTAHPHVKVIGEANSVANAITLCQDLRPNLIFLDVQLGDGDGFEVLPKLSPVPSIIFITAYDQYAFRAFEVNAIDYLLKPTSPARLAHALERITYQPPESGRGPYRRDDKMFLRTTNGVILVYVSQVSGIESQENYSIVHLKDGTTQMVRRSMSEWEEILPKQLFCRTGRTLIVNLEMIRKISMIGRDETEVIIEGFPSPLPLGRKAAVLLKKAMREPNLL